MFVAEKHAVDAVSVEEEANEFRMAPIAAAAVTEVGAMASATSGVQA